MEKKRILICDDEYGVQESLKLILQDDYELSVCNNGQECFDLLMSGQEFNLVLMDIKMPKSSGLEILRKLQKSKPGVRVIIITGYRCMDTAQEAIKAGALDYIIKPFEAKDILASVARNIR